MKPLIPTEKKFAVGDQATFTVYSDSHAGYITKVSKSGGTVLFQRANAELLNGPNSGADDALQVYPGGFVAHVEGTQRYKITPNPNGWIDKFTYRDYGNGKGVWKLAGSPTRSGGNTLGKGHYHHYDYNF